MKTGEAEDWLTVQLQPLYGAGEAAQMASMVMEHITGSNRSQRLLQKDMRLASEQLQQLTEIFQRLQQHEPVQYVLNEAWFYNLKLFVDQSVLIPRPETEELAHWIVKDVQAAGKKVFDKNASNADTTTELRVIDIGTGSGCIALALKHAMPRAEVWGCDASDDALGIARRNASELDIRVDFVGLNFLAAVERKQLPAADVVVSNPPYIPLREKRSMHPNVVLHEPHQALFVPDDDPLIFYKALAQFGKERLHAGGAVYAEIHEDQGAAVVQLFESAGFEVFLKKDMQGKDRMVKAVPA